MSEKTPLQEVADAYSGDGDAMEVLRQMDDEVLRELDRTLQGISNSINIILDEE